MKVRAFHVGPIVGATASESVRIFGRGEFELDAGRPRQAHALLRIRERGQRDFLPTKYFKLNPNFDMSAVTVWEDLSPETRYEYQAGYVYSDVASNQINLEGNLDWSGIEIYRFKTASNANDAVRTIVVGSCRYLLRLFGGSWFDDRGDKTFRSISRQNRDSHRFDALIMTGDQIYADDLNILLPDDALDEYYKRYRTVFSQKYIRQVMAQIPTYMTLDDHEIEDNWPAKASDRDYVTKFPAAIHAYQTYQTSHSPLHPLQNGRVGCPPDRLWYTHRDGCCDFFFTDTRTERTLDDDEREIISSDQLSALLGWLADGSGRVKIIVTAVPFWESTKQDKWNGFLRQRDQILEHIRRERISRVLILSGDVHASMSSELHLAGQPDFKIVSVVSSAFYWPYPHPSRRKFLLEGLLETDTGQTYQIRRASEVYRTDNFTRLRIEPDRVRVEVFPRKGDQQRDRLGSKIHTF